MLGAHLGYVPDLIAARREAEYGPFPHAAVEIRRRERRRYGQ